VGGLDRLDDVYGAFLMLQRSGGEEGDGGVGGVGQGGGISRSVRGGGEIVVWYATERVGAKVMEWRRGGFYYC
jgi:hypothetical protein